MSVPTSGLALARAAGCPVAHNKNSLTAGPHGPTLLQDIQLVEKLQHFDREQTPPRNVHALGSGAYGTFTCTNPELAKYTRADLFSKVGLKTDLVARLSGTFTKPGEAETVRDVRGFALKFYTNQGNWDLMCINMPVFNCRDAKIGPEAIHSFKRDLRTDEWNPENSWKFVLQHREALHQALMLYSDREGTPMSYRMMHAYGCNTFSFYTQAGKRHWVKFHLRSEQGAQGFNAQEARLIAGIDPDWLKRDLRQSIETKKYPRWKLCFQVMEEEEGYKRPEAFDCTKVWKHSDFPLIEAGVIELNRLPIDYFAEVEQVAFSPSNVVPGIGFSPDKLLQGRVFLYQDTQFHRLGPNYFQIPVNRPHHQIPTQYYAGQHQSSIRDPRIVNSLLETPSLLEPAFPTDGNANVYDYPNEGTDFDYYGQARQCYGILSDKDKQGLVVNIAQSFCYLSEDTKSQVVDMLANVSQELADSLMLQVNRSATKLETPNEKLWHHLHNTLHPEVTSA